MKYSLSGFRKDGWQHWSPHCSLISCMNQPDLQLSPLLNAPTDWSIRVNMRTKPKTEGYAHHLDRFPAELVKLSPSRCKPSQLMLDSSPELAKVRGGYLP